MHLLTGATGYVGGRLLRRLEQDCLPVRCLCRNPEALRWRVASGTELVQGDLLQPASLGVAFTSVHTAFHLVHSMQAGEEFEAQERQAAANFAAAARKAGVQRIIYLGGLACGDALSPHMHSRAETGNILRSSGIRVIEFQASIVIGSGSASFEMIRALVERLPLMITAASRPAAAGAAMRQAARLQDYGGAARAPTRLRDGPSCTRDQTACCVTVSEWPKTPHEWAVKFVEHRVAAGEVTGSYIDAGGVNHGFTASRVH